MKYRKKMEDHWTNESSCLEDGNAIPITMSVGKWSGWIQGKAQSSPNIRAELMRVVPKCSVLSTVKMFNRTK